MEQRSQKAACLGLILSAAAFGAEFKYQVRHDHMFRDRLAALVIDDSGVSYKDGKHEGRWAYADIRQLWLAPGKVTVVTYRDRKWRLGIDAEYEFKLAPNQDLRPAYDFLKDKLDRRFVAAIADETAAILWEIPVKLTGALRGSEGVLKVGPDRIVYETSRKHHSRAWRYQDIDNVSSSDDYELTLVTYERAKLHYGSRKAFVFQLKEPLDEARYNLLWRGIQRNKGFSSLH